MTSTVAERVTLFPEPEHTEALETLRRRLDTGQPVPPELPAEVYAALRALLTIMKDAGAVVIAALPDELSTGEAAEVLGVSRPTIVRLAEEGEIEYTRPAVHRRVSRESLLAYRERRRSRRGEGIATMLRISEEADSSTDDLPMKDMR